MTIAVLQDGYKIFSLLPIRITLDSIKLKNFRLSSKNVFFLLT